MVQFILIITFLSTFQFKLLRTLLLQEHEPTHIFTHSFCTCDSSNFHSFDKNLSNFSPEHKLLKKRYSNNANNLDLIQIRSNAFIHVILLCSFSATPSLFVRSSDVSTFQVEKSEREIKIKCTTVAVSAEVASYPTI